MTAGGPKRPAILVIALIVALVSVGALTGTLEQKAAAPALVFAMHDVDSVVRSSAVVGFGRLGVADSIERVPEQIEADRHVADAGGREGACAVAVHGRVSVLPALTLQAAARRCRPSCGCPAYSWKASASSCAGKRVRCWTSAAPESVVVTTCAAR